MTRNYIQNIDRGPYRRTWWCMVAHGLARSQMAGHCWLCGRAVKYITAYLISTFFFAMQNRYCMPSRFHLRLPSIARALASLLKDFRDCFHVGPGFLAQTFSMGSSGVTTLSVSLNGSSGTSKGFRSTEEHPWEILWRRFTIFLASKCE